MTLQARKHQSAPKISEAVILVHGLAAGRAVLKPLERSIQRQGYSTLNWGYPSIRGDIQSLGQRLADELQKHEEDVQLDRFHLVTHSMGSILARVALTQRKFARLGRVVMLGPPHGGSRVAANLARVLGRLCPPLAQLADSPDSFVNNLAEPDDCEIGIIAATYDRVIRVEHTCLSNQADHVVVDAGHTSMLFRQEVAGLTLNFLKHGRFAQDRATQHRMSWDMQAGQGAFSRINRQSL